jgi:transposase
MLCANLNNFTNIAAQGTKLQKEHVQPRIKPTRHGQMFWGAFSYYNRSSLVPLLGDPESKRGGITARRILECYKENLPTIISPGSIFQEDNAPTHRAHIVRKWLLEFAEENGVELLTWPAYSPDLNPIENLWNILKQRIHIQYPYLASLPKTIEAKQQLIQAAVAVWEELEPEILKKLVITMPERLQAVIDADGWYTKY